MKREGWTDSDGISNRIGISIQNVRNRPGAEDLSASRKLGPETGGKRLWVSMVRKAETGPAQSWMRITGAERMRRKPAVKSSEKRPVR